MENIHDSQLYNKLYQVWAFQNRGALDDGIVIYFEYQSWILNFRLQYKKLKTLD